ncbi:MAG: hypothetical protein V3R52_08070, partial [Candidatus Neomarinimicrobiota bacterium]
NTYANDDHVHCFNQFIDTKRNSLSSILSEEWKENLDFLSVDIDGLDYEVFESLDFFPKVICIEVNTCHSPDSNEKVSRDTAKINVGQPLKYFVNIAESKGYQLVCFTGNAFFVKKDLLINNKFKSISAKVAYLQHLETIPNHVKEHLYFVNKGVVNSLHNFDNPYLTKKRLELSFLQIIKYLIKLNLNKIQNKIFFFADRVKLKLMSLKT